MENKFSRTKTASIYIETEYSTRQFARTLMLDDANSMMDLMQDFSDYNLKQSKAHEMLDFINRISGEMLRSDFVLDERWYQQAQELIKSVTEL